MTALHQIFIMLITLGVLIAFHEYGHFWVARRCKVKVLRFSIGFGPVLLRWKDKLGTEFALSALPLGGYVKMVDEREDEVAEEDRPFAFNNKPVSQRIAIVSAGPIANFLLAIVIYWFLFLQGSVGLKPIVFDVEPDSSAAQSGLVEGLVITGVDGEPVSSVQQLQMQLLGRIGDTGSIEFQARHQGSDFVDTYQLPISAWLADAETEVNPLASLGVGFYRPAIDPVIAEVMSGSAAAEAGFKAGDRLLSVDGEQLSDWFEWVKYVRPRAGKQLSVNVERDGQVLELILTPREVGTAEKSVGQVGVTVDVPPVPEEYLSRHEYSVFSAWLPALERTWDTAVFSLTSLKKMLFGDISYKQLSGPISIAKVASESADSGIYSYLSLLALLSVSLGVLNLLPIPVLDGGHILFYLIEWVKGAPVPEKVQMMAYQMGLFVVLSVMVLAVVNDLGRLQ